MSRGKLGFFDVIGIIFVWSGASAITYAISLAKDMTGMGNIVIAIIALYVAGDTTQKIIK